MSDPNEAKAPRSGVGLKLVFLVLATAGIAGGLLLRATAPDPEALPPAQAQAPSVETYTLEARAFQPRTTVTGLLEPRREVEIFSEMNGRVISVGADEFDRVEAGQVLVEMDPLLARVAVNRAEAAIARAKSEGILAHAQLKRNQGLAKVDVASRAALDQAENAARQARAARLEAEAALAEARDRLDKMVISAPFAGALRDFRVEAGEYLRPGERVAELLDVDALRVRVSLTDRQIVSIVPGIEANLEADARPGDAFTGRVISIAGAADSTSRKFPVLVEVENTQGRLLPGMVARVDLSLGKVRPSMTLPLDAVLEEFGLQYVFVVEEAPQGWAAVKRRIEAHVIPFRPTELEVSAGLAEGEQIAVSAVRQLRDGMAVRPLELAEGGIHAVRERQP